MARKNALKGRRIGIGASFAIVVGGGLGLLTQNDSPKENNAHIPFEVVARSGKIAPPYQPPEVLATARNGEGQDVVLSLEEGILRIDSRNYTRFAGFILDCYPYVPDFLINDVPITAARTIIVAHDGPTPSLQITSSTERAGVDELPSDNDLATIVRRPTTKYCIPAFVTEVVPVQWNDAYETAGGVQQYCLDIPDSPTQPMKFSEDLSSCQITF